MTTFFSEIRELIYFHFQGFKDIYISFDLYFNNVKLSFLIIF